jgi:outer membrane protein assembly factor BamB
MILSIMALAVVAGGGACQVPLRCAASVEVSSAPTRFAPASQYHHLRQGYAALPAGPDGRQKMLARCGDEFCEVGYDDGTGGLRIEPVGLGIADVFGYPQFAQPGGVLVKGLTGNDGRPKLIRTLSDLLMPGHVAQIDEQSGVIEAVMIGGGDPQFVDADNDGVEDIFFSGWAGPRFGMSVWSQAPFRAQVPRFFGDGRGPFVVGDVDGDGLNEVVGGWDVYRFEDGALVPQWRFDASGHLSDLEVRLGDVNDDGAKDILTVRREAVVVYDAKNREVLWQHRPALPIQFEGSDAGDLNGDGRPDVVFGTMRVGTAVPEVIALDGTDGSVLWRHAHEFYSIFRPIILDLDGDGANEVAHGAYWPYSGPNPLLIRNGQDGSERWRGSSPEGPVVFALGDLGNDGALEVVAASRIDLIKQVPLYEILSGTDLSLVGASVPAKFPAEAKGGATVVAVSHPTDGSAPKIGIGTYVGISPQVYVVDSATGDVVVAVDRENMGDYKDPTSMLFADLTGDGQEELIVGLEGQLAGQAGAPVHIFDSVTGAELATAGLGFYAPSKAYGLRAAKLREGMTRQVVVTVDPSVAGAGAELGATDHAGVRLWETDRSFRYLGVDVADLDGDGLDEVIAGTAFGEIHVRAPGDGALIRTIKICDKEVPAVSRSAGFGVPGRLMAACGPRLLWIDAAIGIYGNAALPLADELGFENRLEGFLTPEGEPRIIVSSRDGTLLLRPIDNLPPRVRAATTYDGGVHWRGEASFTFLYEDADGDDVTLDMEFPEGGSVRGPYPGVTQEGTLAHTYYFSPAPRKGRYAIWAQADDGQDKSPKTAYDFLVRNDPPVAKDETYQLRASGDAPVSAVSDPNRDPVTITVVTPPSKGTLSSFDESGWFLYTANEITAGPDTFQVKASDTMDESRVATITIEYPAPPPSSPPTGEGGGGGGGGALGASLGLMGLLAVFARRRCPRR